ncbi:MAG: glycoside hydrolase family 125 protein [Clostridia bacterium]|nr:glycoside hydrolase family 125 protein [Clostridia bacterium]
MLTPSIRALFERADAVLADNPKLLKIFKNCFASTLETTVKQLDNGETFVITGDIPAMWLRDSSAQVQHYLPLLREDEELKAIVAGLIARQVKCINIDAYSNAFNECENNNRTDYDRTELNAWIWERKYEVDSLCYPIRRAYQFWRETKDASIFTEDFKRAVYVILDTFRTEQHHENSTYRFERDLAEVWGKDTETLQNNGRGMPVNYTGMTWSGFRPSDDACTFGYLVPSNMFAVVILGYIMEIAEVVWRDPRIYAMAKKLRHEIDYGIKAYATFLHPKYGRIYAYETDGFGNYMLMDDANVPSLLSLPYLGYVDAEDELYRSTRAFILSHDNPFYFSGSAACGIGSPHTPKNYIWHIALSMQALTTANKDEQKALIKKILSTDAGCDCMHEGFDVNDPCKFTRPWFAWANSLFAELVFKVYMK